MLPAFPPGLSPTGGPVVPSLPIWNRCPPHFTFGDPVATYIQYCILKMWPPLLLNPGDGPGSLWPQLGTSVRGTTVAPCSHQTYQQVSLWVHWKKGSWLPYTPVDLIATGWKWSSLRSLFYFWHIAAMSYSLSTTKERFQTVKLCYDHFPSLSIHDPKQWPLSGASASGICLHLEAKTEVLGQLGNIIGNLELTDPHQAFSS